MDILPLDSSRLEPRDAALAHAIDDACARRWLTLAYLLNRHLKKPLSQNEPKMQGVLLAGAAQLVLLSKIPPHACINHAVEWGKRRIRPGAGGLINAVLRAVAKDAENATTTTDPIDDPAHLPMPDGSAIVFGAPIFPEDPIERLSVVTSTPVGLLEHWLESEPMRQVRFLAMHGLMQPPIILNSALATEALPTEHLIPHDSPGHHVFTGPHDALQTLLRARPDIWVQDPASALAVGSVTDLRPDRVIDLCAGLGTKTRQLRATFPNAEIVATDVHDGRRETLARVFADDDAVSVISMKKVRESHLSSADLILIDAPCSNTGVLARRPEARYRAGAKSVGELAGVQRQIVADSIPLLAGAGSRGQILYSTCSLEPQENEDLAAWAERWHQLRPTRQNRRHPGGAPGGDPASYSDGSFATLLG